MLRSVENGRKHANVRERIRHVSVKFPKCITDLSARRTTLIHDKLDIPLRNTNIPEIDETNRSHLVAKPGIHQCNLRFGIVQVLHFLTTKWT